MRILFLGDMVGRPGREIVFEKLPGLVESLKTDFVIVNGENSAGGFGITGEIFQQTLDAGADVVTTGNHVWDQKEALGVADREDRFLRPANYPQGTPGRGSYLYEARNGARVMVMNIMGRVFMHPELDCPFTSVDKHLEGVNLGQTVDAIFIDLHAEATSEKQCFGHYLDGRVSAVVGTHTHVPTADHKILSGGTAYMSDAGMCGDYDSSLGMDKEEPINRFISKISRGRFEVATGEASLCGVWVDVDEKTGLATSINPIRIGPHLENVTTAQL
ncbi:MAG: TIGR00282 family metallophosphoesterase [Pseudomonadota bacterium]